MKLNVWLTHAERKAASPGEPLYTLPEIADRLKVSVERLRGPGAPRPYHRARHSCVGTGALNKYKLSDFRTWLNSGASQ